VNGLIRTSQPPYFFLNYMRAAVTAILSARPGRSDRRVNIEFYKRLVRATHPRPTSRHVGSPVLDRTGGMAAATLTKPRYREALSTCQTFRRPMQPSLFRSRCAVRVVCVHGPQLVARGNGRGRGQRDHSPSWFGGSRSRK